MKRIVFKDQDHSTNKYDSSILNDFNDSDSDSKDNNNNNNIKNESINNDNIKNVSINNNKVNEKPDNKDIQSNPKMSVMNANKPWNKWGDQISFDWSVFTNFGNKYKSVKSNETTLPTESCDDNDSNKDEEELNF